MLIASLFSVFFAFIYSFGVAKTVFGGDSGDIILSYYFAGVPHPPGYPLNTILGWLITRVPFGSTFAFRANYISVIYQALVLGLVFLIAFKLTKSKIAAISASSILGFTPLFWLYAHVSEVFQLASVLAGVSIVILIEWVTSVSTKKPNVKIFYASLLFWGLAVFHHQTAVFLAPAYLYVFLNTKKAFFTSGKRLIFACFAFLTGTVPYFFIPFAALRHTPVNWDSPTNVGNFWQLVSRGDYGAFAASPDLVGFSPIARLLQVVWYFKVLRVDFTYVGMVLIFLGAVYLFFKKRSYFYFFLLAAIFSGPFFLFYASFPPIEPFLEGVSERFLLLNYFFLAIISAFGIVFVRDFLVTLTNRMSIKPGLVGLTVSLAFLIVPINFAIINFPRADLSKYAIGGVVSQDILNSADPAGIIFLQGDTFTFNTQYSYYVDKINYQSKIILAGRLSRPSYRKELTIQYPELNFPDNFNKDETAPREIVSGLVNANFSKFPIYGVEQIYAGDKYIWLQQGMLSRLYKRDDQPASDIQAGEINKKMNMIIFKKEILDNQYEHFFADNIKALYVTTYTENGLVLLKNGKSGEARKYFNLSLDLDNTYKKALFHLGVAWAGENDCAKAEEAFMRLVNVDGKYLPAWESLGRLYKDCFKDEKKSEEILSKIQEIKTGMAPTLD